MQNFYKYKTFHVDHQQRVEEEVKRTTEVRESRDAKLHVANGKVLVNGNGLKVTDLMGSSDSSRGEKGGVVGAEEQLRKGSIVVQQDLLRFIILHLFFMASTYFHYQIFSSVVQSCQSLYGMIL